MNSPVKSYLVIFEKSATGYGAYVPDLPSCIAAGSTRAITEALIRRGIALHIEGLEMEGLPIPEATSEGFEVAIA